MFMRRATLDGAGFSSKNPSAMLMLPSKRKNSLKKMASKPFPAVETAAPQKIAEISTLIEETEPLDAWSVPITTHTSEADPTEAPEPASPTAPVPEASFLP